MFCEKFRPFASTFQLCITFLQDSPPELYWNRRNQAVVECLVVGVQDVTLRHWTSNILNFGIAHNHFHQCVGFINSLENLADVVLVVENWHWDCVVSFPTLTKNRVSVLGIVNVLQNCNFTVEQNFSVFSVKFPSACCDCIIRENFEVIFLADKVALQRKNLQVEEKNLCLVLIFTKPEQKLLKKIRWTEKSRRIDSFQRDQKPNRQFGMNFVSAQIQKLLKNV